MKGRVKDEKETESGLFISGINSGSCHTGHHYGCDREFHVNDYQNLQADEE